MMGRKGILWLLCLSLLLPLLSGCGGAKTGFTVYDGQGQKLIHVQQPQELYADDRGAYLDIVLTEATAILMEEGLAREEAVQQLFTGYRVYTAFDAQAFSAIQGAITTKGYTAAGCAMTDLQGGLIAAYSIDPMENRAVTPTAPYSAFKPLSVYAPALDSGVISWFTQLEDAPYKQLEEEDGSKADWPANSDNTYSYEAESLEEVISRSLNTTAVRCLSQLGVENAVSFLQTRLGADIAAEAYVLETMGGEEVIGNVALGYLEKGVTPVDMAGWYQIFATDGVYTQPKAITKLCDSGGREIYQRQDSGRQVISAAAAQQMNLLLQSVVSPSGTGKAAACQGVEIAGKTGTGDQHTGNWFVGVTPVFSCAVWHGEGENNTAAATFGDLTRRFYEQKTQCARGFSQFSALRQARICVDTGLEAGKSCPITDTGYIPADQSLSRCDKHS